VSEPPGSTVSGAPGSAPPDPGTEKTTARRSRWWSSPARIGFEFALLFAIAIAAKQALVATGGSYPNPLWLPVIVLSLQHGMAIGLAAAFLAAGAQYWEGFAPMLLSEDLYSYIGRIAAEPVAWCCVALLIGHIRSRQIANAAELEAELAERSRQSTAVAKLCADLRGRTELLERHIAANAYASNSDVVEAMASLNRASWEDFPECLTRFVNLMTSAGDFSIYLLRNDALEVAFQPADEHRLAPAEIVQSDDPLFAAIVNERRLISASEPRGAAMLRNRWTLAGPLLSSLSSARAAEPAVQGKEAVIGMFAITDAALEDHPDDIARRFSLTGAEISRLLDQIALVERWNAAPVPAAARGPELSSTPPRPLQPPFPAASAGKAREARHGRQASTMR
jgi:hypothetical protein